jgi:hypothetical protein
MKPEEFCYWLQGVFEMTDTEELNKKQTEILKRHLNMVFEHIAHLDEKDQPAVSTSGWPPSGELERC